MTQADGRLSNLYVSLEEATHSFKEFESGPEEPSSLPVVQQKIREIDDRLIRGSQENVQENTPIEIIRAQFSLEEPHLLLLLAAAAPALSIDFARLYTFAWADFAVKKPTVGFLCELLSSSWREACGLLPLLRADSPLLRHNLLSLQQLPPWGPEPAPLLHASVTVPEALCAFLLGQAHPWPASLAFACDSSPPPPPTLWAAPETHDRLRSSLRRALRPSASPSRLFLLGRPGAGRRTLLAAHLLELSAPPLCVVQLDRLPSEPGAFSAALQAISLSCLLAQQPLLLRLDALLDGPPQPQLWPLLAQALRHHPTLVAFSASRPVPVLHELFPSLLSISIPELPAALQREVWASTIQRLSPSKPALWEPASRLSMTPGHIIRTVEQARLDAPGSQPLSPDSLRAALRRRQQHALSEVAEPFSTSLTWQDVVLPAELHAALQEILAHARFRDKVYDTWGFSQKLAYGRGLGCLFWGPPGTGKTMVASLIAASLGQDLYRVDLSRVVSKWVGETEKNLARIFDEAQRAQVILLFDEADSLFSQRTHIESANDRFANMEVNFLLQRMESYDGVTILTTNFEESLDEAFKRRLKFRIHFPLPDASLRAELWRSMFPPQAEIDPNIVWTELAENFEMSGGNIKNAALRAAFAAASHGQPISHDDLWSAALAEAREMGRLVSS